jgi:hypothetical protein
MSALCKKVRRSEHPKRHGHRTTHRRGRGFWPRDRQGCARVSEAAAAINPTVTVNAVPFNFAFDATKFLTLAMSGGMFMNFDTTTGRVLRGPMFTFSVN